MQGRRTQEGRPEFEKNRVGTMVSAGQKDCFPSRLSVLAAARSQRRAALRRRRRSAVARRRIGGRLWVWLLSQSLQPRARAAARAQARPAEREQHNATCPRLRRRRQGRRRWWIVASSTAEHRAYPYCIRPWPTRLTRTLASRNTLLALMRQSCCLREWMRMALAMI
jgi:hypothetical protein